MKWFPSFHRVVFVLYIVSLATTMTGMEIFSTLLLVCLLIEYWKRKPSKNRWLVPPFALPFLVFIAVAMAGTLFGPATPAQKFYDFGRMRLFLLYAISFYELVFFATTDGWLKTLFITAGLVGIYGFFQHFFPLDIIRWGTHKVVLWAIPEKRIGPLVIGFFNHHLTFSNVFSFYACLFTALGLSKHPRRGLCLALGGFLFLVIFWTESRAAWMAIPVMLLTIALGRNYKWAAAFLGVVLVVMGTLYFTDPGFHDRFERTFLKQDDFYNLGPRRRLWQAQIQIFKEYPLLGIGYNNNERHCKEYIDRLYPNEENFCGHAHSDPLQILATTGIIGSLVYLWLWWVIFSYSYRVVRSYRQEDLQRWIALGCLAAFVGFQLQGLTQWNFGDAKVLHNLMFFLAVVSALGIRKVPLSAAS